MQKDPYNLLIEATAKNELEDYIMGKKGYEVTDPWVEHATDIAAMFLGGCNRAVQDEGEAFNERFNKALINLLTTAEGAWWVTTLVYYWLNGFQENALRFNLYLREIIPALSDALVKHRASLMTNKHYVGYRFAGGLWEITQSYAHKINSIIGNDAPNIRA
jgi:hypothetical protein